MHRPVAWLLLVVALSCQRSPQRAVEGQSGDGRLTLEQRLGPYAPMLRELDGLRPCDVKALPDSERPRFQPSSVRERLGTSHVLRLGDPLPPDETALLRQVLVDPESYAAGLPGSPEEEPRTLLLQAGERALTLSWWAAERVVAFGAGGAQREVHARLSRSGSERLVEALRTRLSQGWTGSR